MNPGSGAFTGGSGVRQRAVSVLLGGKVDRTNAAPVAVRVDRRAERLEAALLDDRAVRARDDRRSGTEALMEVHGLGCRP